MWPDGLDGKEEGRQIAAMIDGAKKKGAFAEGEKGQMNWLVLGDSWLWIGRERGSEHLKIFEHF